MLVTGYQPAGRVTISNNDFDGTTSWSASCNGQHYWTMLFYGSSDRVTLAGNYIHNVSGRAPKVGGSGDTTLHAVNNLFENIKGHAFDVATGGKCVVEGNVFDGVTQTVTPASKSAGGAVWSAAGSGCKSALGRDCVANVVTSSGALINNAGSSVFSKFSGYTAYPAVAASGVKASVKANAGVGKI